MPDRPKIHDPLLTDWRIGEVLDNGGYLVPGETPLCWQVRAADGTALGWCGQTRVVGRVLDGHAKIFGVDYDPDVCLKCHVELEARPPTCDYCEKPATTIHGTDKSCDEHRPNGGNDED